jgi:hypothetical protein
MGERHPQAVADDPATSHHSRRMLLAQGNGVAPPPAGADAREAANMQRTTPTTLVVGIFDDRTQAEHALHVLKEAGYEGDRVGVAALETPHASEGIGPDEPQHIRVDETTGLLAGGILGGLAGWLIGAAAVAIPGLGALVAAGALVGAVGGAGIGASAGGLIGYLIDRGLSHDEAHYYQERVQHGAVLVTVHATPGDAGDVRTLLQQQGGHDFNTRPAQ